MKGEAIICMLLFVIAVSAIGTGYAYSASIDIDNSFDNYYCVVDAEVDGKTILKVNVINSIESGSNYLGFSSDGTDFQETLSLNYKHTKGTVIVLTIGFSCSTESDDPVINCISNEKTVGSTVLVGGGTKTGTIAGIVLPVGENGTGVASFKFQVGGINIGTSVQMSFFVHPLEVSS